MAFGDLPFAQRLEIVRAAESWNMTVNEFIDLKSGAVNPRVLNQMGIETATPAPVVGAAGAAASLAASAGCVKAACNKSAGAITSSDIGAGLGGLGILVLLYLLWRR